MFNLIGWLIFGGVVGAIAKLIMPGKDPGGCLATIGLGILGSLLGGIILGLLLPGRTMFDAAGWIGSVLGAILILWLYRRWAKNRAVGR
jgi:uncharacterized membrane protein YeaQ/YmgE (transglycosylase-associated protein family)